MASICFPCTVRSLSIKGAEFFDKFVMGMFTSQIQWQVIVLNICQKLNNLQITPCGFPPVSFRIPASHYIRYVCPQCIIQVQSFLNLLNAVFTSDQPALQSAIIWNSYYVTLQISCKGTVRSEPFIHYPELMFFESLPIVISGNWMSIMWLWKNR